ncbi:MAG: DUF1178 family protein [Thermohalobaculum sp.]|nr:DUF1178 family protein [Thermohalobaculum sp.]
MIRYALRCAHGHGFDAWFRDSAAYDEQRAAGQVRCAVCADPAVEKAVMAPSVVSGGGPAAREAEPPDLGRDRPASSLERALAELRRRVEESADYVGTEFADEARRIHAGEAGERPIWGEATVADARALGEEGIPVAPLPFLRRRND